MIKLLNPLALKYLYISIGFCIVIFIYLTIRRRRFVKQLGLSDSIYWYIIQLFKVMGIILLVLAMTIPVSIHIREKHLPLEELSPEVKSILENLTTLHVLIVDESLSMLYIEEANTSRYNYVVEFIEEYLKQLPINDIVLITGFAEDSRIICVGKPSYCIGKLSEIKPGRNYTNIDEALGYAKTYADASQYPSVFIVVSDGVYTKGGDPINTVLFINETYPVLFVRIGLDPRANNLVLRLQETGIRVLSINRYTKLTIFQQLPRIVEEMRIQSFITKKILEIKTIYEDTDPYPTLLLITTSCLLFVASRIEGF